MRNLLDWIRVNGRCPQAHRLVLAAEHGEEWALVALAPLVALYADTETPISEVEDRLVEIIIDEYLPAVARSAA